jgi:hypothetical protein
MTITSLLLNAMKCKVPCASTQHHTMKAYWVVQVQLHVFLTSALDGGEWSASHPGCFTPRVRYPGTHWRGGWVGPWASLDVVVKRKIPSPCWDSNPLNIQPIAQRYSTELSWLQYEMYMDIFLCFVRLKYLQISELWVSTHSINTKT